MANKKLRGLDVFKEYNSVKFHGNIPLSSKCQFNWGMGVLCIHQITELLEFRLTRDELFKRDFDVPLPNLKCKLCGYKWISRKVLPKQCPKCKRYGWGINEKSDKRRL